MNEIETQQLIPLQTLYITFVSRQIIFSITATDIHKSCQFFNDPTSFLKLVPHEGNSIFWPFDMIMKEYQGVISDKDAQNQDKEIIKNRQMIAYSLLFSTFLLENSMQFFLNGKKCTPDLMSNTTMRYSENFLELAKSGFSKLRGQSVDVDYECANKAIDIYFFARDKNHDTAYERACLKNKYLNGINDIFCNGKLVKILKEFTEDLDYTPNGKVAQYIQQNYRISSTEINRVFIPIIRLLYLESYKSPEDVAKEVAAQELIKE